MSPPLQNPKKWRFTWEALAHIPTLRLLLSHPDFDPSFRCVNPKASLKFEESLLLLSWTEPIDGDDQTEEVLLKVPVPRVLIDLESPVDLRATADHIEVNLVLLLPVDHPIVVDFRRDLESDGEGALDRPGPFSLDSDVERLSAGCVHFYCKSCSTRLTKKPLRYFVEMPSINWREAADNWFGTCCCSFGGISEKLVSGYVNSYACEEGKCLVDETSVIICKDDFEGCGFPDFADERPKHDHLPKEDLIHNLRDSGACPGGKSLENGKEGIGEVSKSVVFFSPERDESITDQEGHVNEGPTASNSLCCSSPGFPHFSGCGKVSVLETPDMPRPSLDGTQVDGVDSLASSSNSNSKNPAKSCVCSPAHVSSAMEQFQCCRDTKEHHLSDVHDSPLHAMSTTSSESQQSMKNPMHINIDGPLRNGFLGSGFMIRTSGFSSDVKWVEFRCRNCSSVIGSYPSINGIDAPVDSGIRLFKCYVSTSLPIGGPQDIFRKHSLQRVFLHLLLESATDEISFRTLVRNLRTNSPMLQIILLNQKMWRTTGYCSDNEVVGLARGVNLKSVAKVLFCDCSVATEADLRVIEDWSKKNQVDEVYMLTSQIEELIDNLKREQTVLPHSGAVIQGFLLSSLDR